MSGRAVLQRAQQTPAPEAETSRPPRRRFPTLAAILSAIVPGVGQLYAGRIRRGLLFLLPVVLAGVGVAVLASRDRFAILELVVQPRVLWALLAVNAAILGVRLFAVVDAYLTTRPGRVFTGVGNTLWGTALLLLLVLVVALPHVVVGQMGLETIDTLNTVFVREGEPPSIPLDQRLRAVAPLYPTTTTTLHGAATYDPVQREYYIGGRKVTGMLLPDGTENPLVLSTQLETEQELGEIQLPTSPLLPVEGLDDDRITVLLAGGDRGPGRGGLRTDTIIVATVDTSTGHAALFGIPRELSRVPLPAAWSDAFANRDSMPTSRRVAIEGDGILIDTGDGGTEVAPCHCFPTQINAIYPFTRTWSHLFPSAPDPGMEALRQTVSLLLGIPIDYYVLVDMRGFVRLVDALGGVDVMVTRPVHTRVSPVREGAEWIEVHIGRGWRHLHGLQALAYVRERFSSSDYVRMERQRCMLRAVAAQADPLTIISSFPKILDAIESSTTTNVPLSAVPDLIRFSSELTAGEIDTVGFGPPDYASLRDHQRKPIPDVGAIRAAVRETLENPGATVSGGSEDEFGECGF